MRSSLKSPLPLLLLATCCLWPTLWASHCPTGCICADKVILCTCSGDHQFDTLSPFRGIDYIGKVFVHSCPQLTIPSDTFSSLAVGQEISIMDIGNLTIDQFAFRDMLKYPDQFTIRDSGVHLLAEHSFAGFQQAKHMWFRNVTIRTIGRNAFSHVSKVEYIYFREVNVGSIQSLAFAGMSQVSNVFIRSKVHVDHVGHSLFRHSKLDKFVLEDAKIGSMNAYALCSADKLDNLQLFNVHVGSTSFNLNSEEMHQIEPTKSGDNALLYNVAMDKVALGAFSNFAEVKFEHCQIDRLSSGLMPLNEVGSLTFASCTVKRILPNAFANVSRVKSVKFESSTIERIERTAFRNVHDVDYLLLLGSTVKMVEQKAMDNCVIGQVIVDNCQIHEAETASFSRVRSTRWQIVESNLNRLSANLFQESQFKKFLFERNNATGEGMAGWLGRMHADYVNISGNWFAAFQPELFSRASFGSMDLTANRLRCLCDQGAQWLAEMMLLEQLSTKANEPVVSMGTDNTCWDPKGQNDQSIGQYHRMHCPQTTKQLTNVHWPVQGITCTTLKMLTECHCDSDEEIILDFANTATTLSTSVLRVFNCTKLRIDRGIIGRAHTVIFKRSGVVLDTQPFTQLEGLKTIRFEDCQIRLVAKHAFTTRSRLVRMEWKNANVEDLEVHSLSQSNLDELVILDSKLGTLAPSMADGSTMAKLTITRCRIGRMSWSSLQGIRGDHLTMDNNIIDELDGASFLPAAVGDKQFCFSNNMVACNDTASLVSTIRSRSKCDPTTNKCMAGNKLVNLKHAAGAGATCAPGFKGTTLMVTIVLVYLYYYCVHN